MSRYDDEFGGWGRWPRYVPVAERRQKAERAATKLARGGRELHPVAVQGRTVAKTPWGKGWCDTLASYGDYANRLPRGTGYLRNGAVIDLGIQPGRVDALVCGTRVYNVRIDIKPLGRQPWRDIKGKCAGQITSLIDLLRGKLSPAIMAVIARRNAGLFPAPAEIKVSCSCPDWAVMCKHVAAVLFGVGTRLDEQPELLFVLRGVDHLELIAEAPTAAGSNGGKGAAAKAGAMDTATLGTVFGIELADEPAAPARSMKRQRATKAKTTAKATTKTKTKRKATPAARASRTAQSTRAARTSRATVAAKKTKKTTSTRKTTKTKKTAASKPAPATRRQR